MSRCFFIIDSTATIPSAEATWASITPPLQSPTAYMFSIFVCMNLLTETAPFTVFIPSSSNPMLPVTGFLPMDKSTFSASKDLSPFFEEVFTIRFSADLEIETTLVSVYISIPLFINLSLRGFTISPSMFATMSGSISTIVTLQPNVP
ncbi:hypothetical protein SDC9_140958 [bioreactor metagenome]|uniref:Uncharacterized protein n=1 Tax=bioreactor metagenome TaxID=1076179 RepID=A0A645DWV1_9ZZZZ